MTRNTRAGAGLMAVTKLMADLMIDRVRAIGRQRRSVVRDGVLPPVQVDDHLTGQPAGGEAVGLEAALRAHPLGHGRGGQIDGELRRGRLRHPLQAEPPPRDPAAGIAQDPVHLIREVNAVALPDGLVDGHLETTQRPGRAEHRPEAAHEGEAPGRARGGLGRESVGHVVRRPPPSRAGRPPGARRRRRAADAGVRLLGRGPGRRHGHLRRPVVVLADQLPHHHDRDSQREEDERDRATPPLMRLLPDRRQRPGLARDRPVDDRVAAARCSRLPHLGLGTGRAPGADGIRARRGHRVGGRRGYRLFRRRSDGRRGVAPGGQILSGGSRSCGAFCRLCHNKARLPRADAQHRHFPRTPPNPWPSRPTQPDCPVPTTSTARLGR